MIYKLHGVRFRKPRITGIHIPPFTRPIDSGDRRHLPVPVMAIKCLTSTIRKRFSHPFEDNQNKVAGEMKPAVIIDVELYR
jgi:hypothetical protein